MSNPCLDIFHTFVREWFVAKYHEPTDIQEKAWPLIAAGKNVLITAPTGSGKTLAAFLWAIDMLVSGKWEAGATRLIYISPLKALNNDVRENLIVPLAELGSLFKSRDRVMPAINVLTRSGDTPSYVRTKMMKSPPDILITTPESLNIILNTERGHLILATVRTVILDEIHALLPNKRGTHTITAVERLTLDAGEFQRIALSATVNPVDTARAFVGGYAIDESGEYCQREVSVVRSEIEKKISVRVVGTVKGEGDSVFPQLIPMIRERIKKNKATLVFTNSRRMCEQITRLINENEPHIIAYSHHGSLSRELRLYVEKMLRGGELSAIVATSSLELGIDIGHLDEVVLVEAPSLASAGLQRIGRAGHKVGETSVGIAYPLHGLDYLKCAVIARLVADRNIEDTSPVTNPLDVLSQVILGLCVRRSWQRDDLLAFLRTSFPFHTLSENLYALTLGMLSGKYGSIRIGELAQRLLVDPDTGIMKALASVRQLLFLSGGTISDRGYFELRVENNGMKIGELDEEFVWERRIGHVFNLGSQNWQITKIDAKTVEVRAVRSTGLAIPFWKGERTGEDFHVAEQEGLLLELAESSISNSELMTMLSEQYFMDQNAAETLVRFITEEKSALGGVLPHRHRVIVEHVSDKGDASGPEKIVIHTFWGAKVNQAFAFALQTAWENTYGYAPDTFVDDSAVLVAIPHESAGYEIFRLLAPEKCETYVRARLPGTGYFGARFRENAGRALLLPRRSFGKRTPFWLTRLRARKLYEAVTRFDNFPIVLETFRTCMQDEFDIPRLVSLLTEIDEGKIQCTDVHIDRPSPFTLSSVWRETNTYMYQGDEPNTQRAPLVSDDLFSEITKKEWLRPSVEPGLVSDFERKIQRIERGYSPSDTDELQSWIDERLLIGGLEWEWLLDAMERDHETDKNETIASLSDKVFFFSFPKGSTKFLASVSNLELICDLFGIGIGELEIRSIADMKPLSEYEAIKIESLLEKLAKSPTTVPDLKSNAKRGHFLVQWLKFYGIVQKSKIEAYFGESVRIVFETFLSHELENVIITGELSTGSTEIEFCHKDNFERLLRIGRKLKRESFVPLPESHLQLFLAAWQGLTEKRSGIEGLKTTLGQLFGIVAQAELWEEEILPARIRDYKKTMLDSLFDEGALIWFGAGKEKVGFCFEEDADLFINRARDENITQVFPQSPGKFGFWDIAEYSSKESAELTAILWEMVWGSKISNSSFETIRKGITNGFKPVTVPREQGGGRRRIMSGPGMGRWKASRPVSGLWFVLRNGELPDNEFEMEQMRKARAYQLLSRYGIFFRGLHENESDAMSWKNLFRTLAVMELGSEIRGGYFFEGRPGPQFVSKEAYEFISTGLDENAIFSMNASDPASLCGASLRASSELLPARLPSTHLVFHGTLPVVVSRRNYSELDVRIPPDHKLIEKYLSLLFLSLGRDYSPVRTIKIETINGERADKSPYGEVLASLKFVKDYGAYKKRGSY